MGKADTVLVVLAGGRGRRLGVPYPKVLLVFGGRTLAEWALDAFAEAGVREAVIVAGWKAELVQELLGRERSGVRIRYIVNDRYEETGAGYGLLLAQEHWKGRPCVVMEGDQLLHPLIIRDLMEGPEDCLPVKAGRPELGEETVVVGRDGKVERLVWPAKDVRKDEAVVGEAIVMAKLSAKSSRRLVEHLDTGEIIEPLNALDLSYMQTGLPWIEIDTPEDLAKAREIYLKIEG